VLVERSIFFTFLLKESTTKTMLSSGEIATPLIILKRVLLPTPFTSPGEAPPATKDDVTGEVDRSSFLILCTFPEFDSDTIAKLPDLEMSIWLGQENNILRPDPSA
jgi:hypothetical protein